jgi:hypothetical protein
VYHFSEGRPQASNGLRNIGNHLEVDAITAFSSATDTLS